MTITSAKWIFILYLAIFLFFFGDSLVDNGNNNMRIALRANYPPNGIDYPDADPTGSFSNGRNLADYLGN